MFRRDSRAVVLYMEKNPFSPLFPPNYDASARGIVFHGVLEKIDENLLHPTDVGIDRWRLDQQFDLMAFFLPVRLNLGQDPLGKIGGSDQSLHKAVARLRARLARL